MKHTKVGVAHEECMQYNCENRAIKNLTRVTYSFSSFHLKMIRPHSCQGRLDLRTVFFSNVYSDFRSCLCRE